MICETNANLGCGDNMFYMLGRNLDDFMPRYIRSHDPSIHPCSLYLENLPRKVMWATFFTFSYEFSEALDKIKRILIVFRVIFVIASYLVFLVHGLMVSDLMSQVLKL